MKAMKCDRCSNYYIENKKYLGRNKKEKEPLEGVTLWGRYNVDESFDLCDDCINEFLEFMKINRETNLDGSRR